QVEGAAERQYISGACAEGRDVGAVIVEVAVAGGDQEVRGQLEGSAEGVAVAIRHATGNLAVAVTGFHESMTHTFCGQRAATESQCGDDAQPDDFLQSKLLVQLMVNNIRT